jgi:hypothetical protein
VFVLYVQQEDLADLYIANNSGKPLYIMLSVRRGGEFGGRSTRRRQCILQGDRGRQRERAYTGEGEILGRLVRTMHKPRSGR